MSGITSAGAGSGIDFEAVIQVSVDAYKTGQERRLTETQESNDLQISAIGTLKSAVSTFKSAVEELNDIEDFQKRTAEIKQDEDNQFLSADLQNNALVGSYEIEVVQAAQGSRAMSAEGAYSSQDDVVSASDGSLTFTAGVDDDGNPQTFTVDVTAGMTLGQLAERINYHEDNIGVGATILNTGSGVRLIYSSEVTGDGNDLAVTGSVSPLTTAGGMAIDQSARSAAITIDGIEIKSESNTFDDVITDVSLTIASDAKAGDKATLGIDRDDEGLKESMKKIVSTYNSLVSEIDNLVKPGGDLGSEKSVVRSLQGSIFNALSTRVDENGTINSIWTAGFDIDNDGVLSVDDEDVDKLIEDYYDQIGGLLSGENGVLTAVEDVLKPYTQRGGTFDDWKDRIETEQKEVGDRLSDIQISRSNYEQGLRERYGALDAQIAELNSQQSFVLALLR